MSTRNLDALLAPASVVVVGASARPDSVGATAWRNLRAGQFKGAVYAVNPKHRRLDGQSVYARLDQLPAPADLALVCTPAATVPGIVAELGRCGTRAAIVLSAGLDVAQRQAMLDAARPHLLRVLGPGCVGMLSPHIGLNASIAHGDAMAGELAFVSQSGSLLSAMLDWARERAIGFSQLLSLGQHADVDSGDLLDLLASDSRTRSILLYLDTVESPRKFMSAARAAARNKPVIVVRAGRAAPGQAADTDRVYDAAFARAGMLRVCTLQQMFLAAETLARFRTNRSEQLAVLSNGSGAAALAADAAARDGVRLCALQPRRRCKACSRCWPRRRAPRRRCSCPATRHPRPTCRRCNAGPATRPRQRCCWCMRPARWCPSAQVARALLPLAQSTPPQLLGCWLGHAAVAEARHVFAAGRHRHLRHAGRSGERVLDAGRLPPQPGAADRGAAQRQPRHRPPTPLRPARWCKARWAAAAR